MEFIVSILVGVMLGNFATTILYRIPRNITICGLDKKINQPPFCSFCHHPLKYYEFLPILSWISTRGKCNYCRHPIPLSYTVLEILGCITSVVCYTVFGLGDLYILLLIFCLLCAVNSFAYLEHGYVSKIFVLATIATGAVYATLIDGTIMRWVENLSITGFCSVLLIKRFGEKKRELNAFIITALIASLWTFGYCTVIYTIVLICLYVYKYLTPQWGGRYSVQLFPLNMALLYIMVMIQNVSVYLNEM